MDQSTTHKRVYSASDDENSQLEWNEIMNNRKKQTLDSDHIETVPLSACTQSARSSHLDTLETSSPVIGISKYQREQNALKIRAANDQNNYAMQSRNSGSIIIIKPEENIRKIMSSPGKFSMALATTDFNKVLIKDIRTNFKKGLIIIELADNSRMQKLQLLQVTQIGDWKVNCYIPTSDQFRVGVVSPIDTKEDLSSVQNFHADNEARIHKIERIMKSDSEGNKISTTAVKIMFETTELPQRVKMFHFSYRVRPYIPIGTYYVLSLPTSWAYSLKL